MRAELVTLEDQVDVLQRALVSSARQNDDLIASNASRVSALEEAEERVEAMNQLLTEATTQIENLSKEKDSLQTELQETQEMAHAHNRKLEAELQKTRKANALVHKDLMGSVAERDLTSLYAALTKQRDEAASLDRENVELAVLVEFLQGRVSMLERSYHGTQNSQHSTAVGFAQLDALEQQLRDSAKRCCGLERRDGDIFSPIMGESGISVHDLIYWATEVTKTSRKFEDAFSRTRAQLAVSYLSLHEVYSATRFRSR